MESLKNYFLANPSASQVLLYGAIILSLWLTEASLLAVSWKDKWKHTVTNLLFIGTALPVQLFMTIFVLIIVSWSAAHRWGLLFMLPYAKSYFTKYLIGLVLLDFCEYLYHVIMHKMRLFWKFHLVHHSDIQLDVSTTVREHPAETFLRMCFLMLWVFFLGASFGVLLLRQTLQTIANITSHTKFRLPPKANRVISWVFITPNLHHVHHHYQLPYTDKNYGDILSIWDRLFKTFHQDLPVSEITYGINTHMDESVNGNFIGVIKSPFLMKPQESISYKAHTVSNSEL